jgi:hypothetical protein
MKTKTTRITFVNGSGQTRRFDGKMTLRELMARGVTHISIVKPEAPLKNGEWRSTP